MAGLRLVFCTSLLLATFLECPLIVQTVWSLWAGCGPARRDPRAQLRYILSIALPVLAVALLASLAALAIIARRSAASTEGEEEALLRRTVAQLRERLHLTRKDGFYLSNEQPPSAGWRTVGARHAPPVCLRSAHVEALARLELLSDFDLHLVDAMCACLHGNGPLQQPFSRSMTSTTSFMGSAKINLAAETGCSPQETALRAWLLGLARELLDPTIDDANAAAQPEPKAELWWRSGGVRLESGGPLGLSRLPSSRSSRSSTIRPEEDRSSDSVHADVEHGGRTPVLMGASLVKARFAYLENKVGCDAFRRLSARAWFLAECRCL